MYANRSSLIVASFLTVEQSIDGVALPLIDSQESQLPELVGGAEPDEWNPHAVTFRWLATSSVVHGHSKRVV